MTACDVAAAQPDLVSEIQKLTIRLEELEGSVKEGSRRKRRSAGPCYYCGKTGHVIRDCPRRQEQQVSIQPTIKPNTGVPHLGVYSTSKSALTVKVNVLLNDRKRQCLVNTGESVSLLPLADLDSLAVDSLSEIVELQSVSGAQLIVRGIVTVPPQLGDWKTIHKFVAVDIKTAPILGADF